MEKEIIQSLLKYYMTDEQIEIFIKNLDTPEYNKGAVLNTEKINFEQLKVLYPNIEKNYTNIDEFINFTSNVALSKDILHYLGAYYIVDPSSLEVILPLIKTLKQNSIVLDLCAAPGGKTIILALLRKDIIIISNEINAKRNTILRHNVERLGLTNVIVTNNSIDDFINQVKLHNSFDAIILDVPCSGSGMIRKKDKMDKDYSDEKVENLIPIQKDLINKSKLLLKKEGLLVYSTCSYNVLEDEDIVNNFISSNKDFSLINLSIPNSFSQGTGYHLVPPFYKGEGHYVCALKRNNDSINDNELAKILPKNKKYGSVHLNQIDDSILDCYFKELDKLNVTQKGVNILDFDKNSKSKFNVNLLHVKNISIYPTIELNYDKAI